MRNRLREPIWNLATCSDCKMALFDAKQAEERLQRMGAVEIERHSGCGHAMAYRSGGSARPVPRGLLVSTDRHN